MWIPIEKEPAPIGETVILTDGKNMIIGEIYDGGTFKSIHPNGVGGYEMECDFEVIQITHWKPAPMLP